MLEGTESVTTTRRGALKTGALGLGGLTGALALGSSSAAAAATALPSMGTVATLAGVSGASYFLHLDGIPGDSVDAGHPGWVDLAEYSWKASNVTTVAGSGSSASKPTISAITLSSSVGPQSAPLFLRTMNGKRLATAMVEGVARGDSPHTFLRIELTDVSVSSYETMSGDESPRDVFGLTFAVITYSIILQSSTGGVGQTISATWNVRTGTATGSGA